jgi:Na+/H+ antiporter NhaC
VNRTRFIIPWIALIMTFGWLFLPDRGNSPAVLWPSVVAVGLAFVTRDIYVSLFVGAFAGAVLLRNGNFAVAFFDLFTRHLIPALTDPWNVSVMVFTLLMGGLVEVLHRGGGMGAMAERLLRGTHAPRRAGLGIYAMGWLVFFDGLANSMLVGKSMRPVADRAGLSREKLSLIVDSTSSPIAGLALISTWVAYEMSVIRQGFDNLGNPELAATIAPYQLLVQSLPYRFYNWFCLLLVFLAIWLGRDIGPMIEAERKARRAPRTDPAVPVSGRSTGRIWLALTPLSILIVGVFGGLFVQGGGLGQPLTMVTIIDAFGKADAALVFTCATAVACVVAMVGAALFPPAPSAVSVVTTFFEGMKHLFLPLLILVFAWVLNSVIREMGTASYLVSLLQETLAPGWLPALVFVLAAVVSFSTGTSWGTMAIVMPLVVPVAVRLAGMTVATGMDTVVVATIGAVLAGAVFGDHCSPISDTTIVSAFSCDCDAVDHVRTQLPYALSAAGISIVLGYGPAGWLVTPLLLLPLGATACWAILRFAGRN